MEPLEETYANASIILRPARVAILFRGGEHWQAWARLAISVAGKYWGGAGFILVPFSDDGTVAPEIIAVVTAYDPDHVVTVSLTLREMERVAPGFIPLHAGGKLLVNEDERRTFLAGIPDVPQREAAALKARAAVAEACTPLRNAYGPADDDQRECIEQLDFEVGDRSGWLLPAVRDHRISAVLAGSESWTGAAALSLAIRTGILPFSLEEGPPGEREEPDTWQMIRLALTPERWSREAPAELIQRMNVGASGSGELPFYWFDEPESGLTPMRNRWGLEGGAIVIGDSAEDFALAYAYERLLGFGVWLTPEMLQDKKLTHKIRSHVMYASQRVYGNAQRLTISSSSVNKNELERIAAVLHDDVLNADPFSTSTSGGLEKNRRLPDGVEIGVPKLQLGLYQLAVVDPFVTSISVPVSVGQDGTTYMRAPLPTPMPTKLITPNDGRTKPYWYVSVDLETSMPKGRGVPQEFVQSDTRYANNAVRSGREGLAFHSQAGGLVPAGSALSSQLYKPKLKVLGMQPWLQAMVRLKNMEAAPSLPGMHAQLLARRLGGRPALISMVSGYFHPALQMFASGDKSKKAKRTDEVFPQGDGVALGYDPYPQFEALRRALPNISDQDLARWIDRLAEADLIRRGFILDCSDCSRPSFVGIDDVGQRFQCVRCSAVNELTSTRWKNSGNEPPWFYDLHASFRELMATNGDVGLFAARHLGQGAWEYCDNAEIEFYRAGTRTRLAEIDLVAHVNGEVIVVEAKSNGRLGTSQREARAAAKKKIAIAMALHADKVILATTASTMAEAATQVLQEAADAAGASDLQIEALVGLGPECIEPESTFDI